MPSSLDIYEFLKLAETHAMIDVRTPAEYEHGHIPGATNLPLFSNEERVTIGTLYKQEGKEAAILKGLELVGPKLRDIVEQVNSISKEKTILTHCWRGGMRSSSVAWLLEMYGYKVYTLKKGYKAYRNFALETFLVPRKIIILGGRTGSGKTLILSELSNSGEEVIDLERLACHKGSSYGSLGETKQPSQEAFENELALQLYKSDPSKRLWLEDESRKIGIAMLPHGLWEQMRNAILSYIDLAMPARVNYLVEEYGKFSKEELKAATSRISKKLGGQHAKRALEAIDNNDLKTACEISLVYYDRAYDYGCSERQPEKIVKHFFNELDVKAIAKAIRAFPVS